MKSKRKRFLVPSCRYGLSAQNNRRWMVYLAGQRTCLDEFERKCDWFDTRRETIIAHESGARIPRSLRHHIKHPSWSIDPNYVKLRKLVREGRRIADAWERQRETVKIWVEKEKP